MGRFMGKKIWKARAELLALDFWKSLYIESRGVCFMKWRSARRNIGCNSIDMGTSRARSSVSFSRVQLKKDRAHTENLNWIKTKEEVKWKKRKKILVIGWFVWTYDRAKYDCERESSFLFFLLFSLFSKQISIITVRPSHISLNSFFLSLFPFFFN